jgi:hypothetical protein
MFMPIVPFLWESLLWRPLCVPEQVHNRQAHQLHILHRKLCSHRYNQGNHFTDNNWPYFFRFCHQVMVIWNSLAHHCQLKSLPLLNFLFDFPRHCLACFVLFSLAVRRGNNPSSCWLKRSTVPFFQFYEIDLKNFSAEEFLDTTDSVTRK